MILPSKHLSQERALLTVGARVLSRLSQPKTVSALWEEVLLVQGHGGNSVLSYDAFVLTLDLLFSIKAISFADGLVSRSKP